MASSTSVSAAALLEGRLGAIQATRPRPAGEHAGGTASYTAVSRRVKDEGLLARTPVFYLLLLAGMTLAGAAVIVGMIVLGPSWFQLIPAGVLGVILTQFAFVA